MLATSAVSPWAKVLVERTKRRRWPGSLAGVLLLRSRPRERIEHRDRFVLLADHTVSLQGIAHLVRDGFDLRPGRRDEQRRAALLGGRQVGIGGTLIKLAVIRQRFRDGTEFEQLGEGFVSLLCGSQLDNLPEGGGLLAADGGQFLETVARILFQNPQRVAPGDGGVLAG